MKDFCLGFEVATRVTALTCGLLMAVLTPSCGDAAAGGSGGMETLALQEAHAVALEKQQSNVSWSLQQAVDIARTSDPKSFGENYDLYAVIWNDAGAWKQTAATCCSQIATDETMPTNAQIKGWYLNAWRKGGASTRYPDTYANAFPQDAFERAKPALERYKRLLDVHAFREEFGQHLPGLVEIKRRHEREQVQPKEAKREVQKYVRARWK